MFETIVLAVDGSTSGEQAATYAGQLARAFHSELVVAHVAEFEAIALGAFELEPGDEAAELLESTVRGLKERGVSAPWRASPKLTCRG